MQPAFQLDMVPTDFFACFRGLQFADVAGAGLVDLVRLFLFCVGFRFRLGFALAFLQVGIGGKLCHDAPIIYI